MNLDPSAFIADPDLILALEKQSSSIECGEDRVLFQQGDDAAGLYILDQGEATLNMTAQNGAPILSMKAATGSLLGLPGLIGDQPYTLTAIAHSGARVSYVSRDDFAALMRTDPQLSLKILQVLARKSVQPAALYHL